MSRARDRSDLSFEAWRRCALILVGAGIFLSPTHAVASCGIAPPVPEAIEQARHVFVGEVVELKNDQRTALVAVTDVWKGDVPERVEVHGGMRLPQDPDTYTSIDRTYDLNKTYLFFPSEREENYFRDICTRTSVMRQRFLRFRPQDASTPSPGSNNVVTEGELGSSPQPSAWIFLVGGASILAGGVWIWISIRRRT
ncbi:MAG: hypothetical protein H0U53_03875 [Actinobacteria bacterium]|nr:hypothetical protein [Actinomycetota bacterium]